MSFSLPSNKAESAASWCLDAFVNNKDGRPVTLINKHGRDTVCSLLLTASIQRHDPHENEICDDLGYMSWLIPQTDYSFMILTSVPYLDNAAFANCRIFSLYICAARLLYLALVSFVEQPCWRKNAVFGQMEKGGYYITSQKSAQTMATNYTTSNMGR